MARPSARRRQREHVAGIALIAIGLGFVGALVWWWWSASENAFTIDDLNLCPVEAEPRGYAAFLFDISDPLNDVQQIALRKRLEELIQAVPAYHRVRVFVIRPAGDSPLPKPSFDRCKPPAGDGPANWTENQKKLRERWRSDFRIPLDDALADAMKGSQQHESPIMELIQAAALESFPTESTPRHLVVVSDFLENTTAYSHYGSGPPQFKAFVETTYAGKVHVDLVGARVDMLYLRRDNLNKVQGPEHQEFWKKFFVWSGIVEGGLTIVPIEG